MAGQISDIERKGVESQICEKKVDVTVVTSSGEHLFRNVREDIGTDELLTRLQSIRKQRAVRLETLDVTIS